MCGNSLRDVRIVSCNHPTVTVIVATRGDRPSLADAVDSVARVPCTRREIIIVLSGKHPQPPAFLDSSSIQTLREEKRGVSAARNRGIQQSNGEIIAFCDDDVVAYPDWTHQIIQPFADAGVACVTGRVVPEGRGFFDHARYESRQATTEWRIDRSSPEWLTALLTTDVGFGCNMAFRRSFLKEYDLSMPEALGAGAIIPAGDEAWIFTQILDHGGVLAHAPSAIVNHYFEEDDFVHEARRHQIYAANAALRLKMWFEMPSLRRPLLRALTADFHRLRGRRSVIAEANEAIPNPSTSALKWKRITAYLHGVGMYWRARQLHS